MDIKRVSHTALKIIELGKRTPLLLKLPVIMDLSIIIPVYNEADSLPDLLSKLENLPLELDIIAVDDGSTDNSREILESYRSRDGKSIKVLSHSKNIGKGASIRTALDHVSGRYCVIQDGDLEYDPMDFIPMLEKAKASGTVVYGSRNLKNNAWSSRRFYQGGRFLSELASFLFMYKITDESTCYKMFPTEILKSIPLSANRFEFCPEVTGKLLQNKIQILEVPVTYVPRVHEAGKKIRWTDGFFAIWMLLKLKLMEVLELVHLPWKK